MSDPSVTVLDPVSNDGADDVLTSAPYVVSLTLQGSSALLFHQWSNEAVAEKARASKGSASKKVDNIESYQPRCADGTVGLPGAYLKGSIAGPAGAAKFRQDPRSPRKSALDLFKAGVVVLTDIAPLFSAKDQKKAATEWDYLDQRRVMVQRAGITRQRPAFLAGWTASFDLSVLTPEYIDLSSLLDVITNAGKLVGVGDFRPTFGRFQVTRFELTGTL